MKMYLTVFSVIASVWFAIGFICGYKYFQIKPTEVITSDQIRICEEKGGEYSIFKWAGRYEESCRAKRREIVL